jgi:RNA recognition motif-containing protein
MDGSSRVAILVFETPAAARKVQKKLDQHVVHGNTLSLRPFHPAQQGGKTVPESDGAEGGGEAAAAGGKGGGVDAVSLMRGQAKRNNRLIVRNLSFKATEADLKQALSAFGPVLEATIPKVNVRGVEGRRGFGFVTFACAPDAEKAVKHEGGLKVCGREVAVDMCMGRREYQEEKHKKEKEEQLLKKEEKGEEGTKEEEMEEGSSDSADEEEEREEESEEGEDEEAEEEEEEEEEDDDDDDDEPKEKKPSDIKEGKTIFVRNIPFDATPDSLKLAFHDYAPAAFAIIVKDRVTGMSKGTAFIKFKVGRWVSGLVDVYVARGAGEPTESLVTHPPTHPYTDFQQHQQTTEGLETVLGAASAAGGSLTLLGRDLKIDRAIEREDAPTPKIPGATTEDGGGSSSKSKADRRNLYLANEGLVIDSEAQDEVCFRGLPVLSLFLLRLIPPHTHTTHKDPQGRPGEAQARASREEDQAPQPFLLRLPDPPLHPQLGARGHGQRPAFPPHQGRAKGPGRGKSHGGGREDAPAGARPL